MARTPTENARGQPELDAPVGPPIEQRTRAARRGALIRKRIAQFVEQGTAALVGDRPAIVGIDERKIPQLGALVEVGDTGRRKLDQHLCKAVETPVVRDARLRWQEVL